MSGEDGKLETFFVETRDPGWKTVDDIFVWFDERRDENWIVVSDQTRIPHWLDRRLMRTFGMPMDLQLVEVVRSGWRQGEKFKDYIYSFIGVRADERWPDYGRSIITHKYFPQGGEPIIMYVWGVMLLARKVEARLLMMWNVGEIHGSVGHPAYEAALKNMPEPRWWTELFEVSLFRPNDLIILAKGFELLNKDSSLILKPGGPNNQKIKATNDELKSFPEEYRKMQEELRKIGYVYERLAKENKDWRGGIKIEFSIMVEYPDLIEILPVIRKDAEASQSVLQSIDEKLLSIAIEKNFSSPRDIAAEIAARRVFSQYIPFAVTPRTLRDDYVSGKFIRAQNNETV